MDIRIVGGLPDAPVRTVAGDSPEMPAYGSGGPADAPVRTAASNPPEMPTFKSGGPADAAASTVAGDSPEMPAFKSSGPVEAPVRTVAGDSPEMPAFKSSGPADAPVRTAASNPPGMSLRTVDGNSPGAAGHVVLDAPGDMPAREVGAAGGASPEQAQIIAPAPLPIELPASPVWQQPVSAAPSGVARMFVAAAEAVADAILVSSGFANGEGSLIVRLRPGVLNGSEVRISAKDGALTVVVNAATQDVQNAVESNRIQFEQHLAEKIHSWRISVAVRRGGKTDERV
jgi:flagellar hook-length control protein FliK